MHEHYARREATIWSLTVDRDPAGFRHPAADCNGKRGRIERM